MYASEGDDHCGLMVLTEDPTGRVKVIFTLFHELEPHIYATYLTATSRLQAAVDGSLIVYARQSLENFESVCEQIRGFMRRGPVSSFTNALNNWYTNVVCCVLTFCSALHLYQEQSESEVVRNYGDPSSELSQIKATFSEMYDESLAYRLIYRLRNVLVHHSLKAVGLTLGAKEDTTPAGLILHNHSIRVPLNREIFLQAKKGVSSAIRQELQYMAEDPNLLVVCVEAMAALEKVHKRIFRLVHLDLMENAKLVCELDALFGEQPGVRALGRIPNWDNRPPVQMPHTPLRAELFEYAKELVRQNSNPT